MKRIKRILYLIKEAYLRLTKTQMNYAISKGVQVGSSCRIYTTKFGTEPWLISIGNKVTITSGVFFLTHDGSTWLMNDEKGRRYLYKKIIIKDNVFIGVNSIIMPGVIIEDNVIIAAGSVVTKSIPSGVIVGGNPAKIIGDYSNYKKQVLEAYPSDQDMDVSLNYKNRILNILNDNPKEYLDR